jgi:hypothetical protein
MVLMFLWSAAPDAQAYVGPGAGVGGSGGIGFVGIAVLVLAGVVVLSAVCGIAALGITIARRLRTRSPDA